MWLNMLLPLAVLRAVSGLDLRDLFLHSYNDFLRDFARLKYEMNPESASSEGLFQYDADVTDYTPAGTERNRLACKKFVIGAALLLEVPTLMPIERHYVKLVERECRTYIHGIEFNAHLLAPVNFLENVWDYEGNVFNDTAYFKLENLTDYVLALKRLGKIPKMVDGVIETLELGIEKNITYAVESLSRGEPQLQMVLDRMKDPTTSGFFTPFRDMSQKGFDDKIVLSFQYVVRSFISNFIAPDFVKLRSFLKDKYMKHVRSGPGVLYLPNGRDYYQAAIEYHIDIKGMTPDKLHQIGLDEIEELKKGVAALAKRMGKGDLSFKEFLLSVLNDPEQLFESEEEVLKYATDLLQKKINPKLPMIIPEEYLTEKLFALEVKPVPPGGGGIAYYTGGNEDGTKNGTYFVNLAALDNFRKFEMTALTLHEANPGHHFETTVFRFAYDGIPDFLQIYGAGTHSSVPAATPTYTAFTEGWGLYSEFLGHEMGLYEDPNDLFGFYSYNLLRAGRLVVDTGLHAMGWSRERAVKYLLDHTAMSQNNVEAEIDRYITWPGQALAYKIGERTIKHLRSKKEKEHGNKFDVREFHKHLLSCKGPLDTLEECYNIREADEKKNTIEFDITFQ